MKKIFLFFIGITVLIAFGFFFRFDGYQTNGDFRINGSVYGTTWNGIKIYACTFTQIDTLVPVTLVELENSMGATTTWVRLSTGSYFLSFSGISSPTAGHTIGFVSTGVATNAVMIFAGWNETDSESFVIQTFDAAGNAADLKTTSDAPASLKIYFYP
jgi:hypothetical protein